ncbi:MAG: S-layer homology domain-containing protein, partial [Eubacteriales bacterium]
MLKKWIAICLSVVMIASMAMTATASDYSDLDGHWAEEYLLELADLGYLTGYTDGTMQPDGNITTTEALVLLSRLYNPPDAVLEEISNDYGATVAGILEPSLSWAYDEVEICLAAGIVSSSELSGLPMTSALEKELLSVLLIRTMQRVDDAKSNGTIMTFNDTDDITTAYQPYVAELVELGIINGDNNNNFDPHSSVTRAVVATMMVRALDVLDDDDITLEIPGYEGYRQIEGLVEEAGETDYTFQLRDVTGTLYEIRYDDETVITEGGDEVEMDEDLVGEYATVAFVSTGVSTITIEDNSYTEYWIQGMLSSFSPSGSGYTMYIKNLETSSSSQWIGTNTMTMTKNGESASTLSSGYFVTALVDSSGVVQVDA